MRLRKSTKTVSLIQNSQIGIQPWSAKLRFIWQGSSANEPISGTIRKCADSMGLGLTIESFVLTVLAPAAPILIWGLREYYRQRDAAEALERLKSEAEGLWDRAKTGQCADIDCAAQSRQFQNAIYEMRRRSPIIFGWLYRFHREGLEDQMKHGAEEFVKQL
jgi:hypothetical protein